MNTEVTPTRRMVDRPYGVIAAVAGAVVIAGVATAISAFDVADRSDGSPIIPPGSWHVAMQASLIFAYCAYVLALLAVNFGQLALRWTMGIGVVIQLFPLVGPILLSTDVRVYAAYGRLAALEGTSPYLETPTNQVPSLYGPVFTLESELIALVARDSEGIAVFIHRLLAAACVLLVSYLASLLATRRALALAIVAWNPLIALHFAGGGHNDALMVAIALMALLLARRGKWGRSGALWCASSFVKLLTIALVPIEALALWRTNGKAALARFLAGCSAAAIILVAVASARYGSSWFEAIRTLGSVGDRTGSIGLSHWLTDAGVSEANRGHIVTVLQVGTIGALSYRAARSGHAQLGLAATLLAFFQGWLNPWYAIWGLGFSAADDNDKAGRIASVMLSGYLLTDMTTW